MPMFKPQAKILVVDDEEKNVKLLEALLVPRGYAVVKAYDGAEALWLVQQEQPDLILLDVMMPVVDGFEVCKILKDNPETCLIPVVIMTALGQVEDRVKGIEAGADDFLTKPVHRDELLARIRTSLRLKREIERKLDSPLTGKPHSQPQAAGNISGSIFRQEGGYWTLAYQGTVCRLKDTKGLHYLAFLLHHPGEEFHVIELVTTVDKPQATPAATPYGALSEEQLATYHLSVGGYWMRRPRPPTSTAWTTSKKN
jgi:DNA-binding response OmpR family regulator